MPSLTALDGRTSANTLVDVYDVDLSGTRLEYV